METGTLRLTLYSIVLVLTHQQKTTFKNFLGKGEIAHNKQFLLFPPCFLLKQIIASQFVDSFAIKLEEAKIGIQGKGLNVN